MAQPRRRSEILIIFSFIIGISWTALAPSRSADAQSLGAIGGIGGISGETGEATPLFTMTGSPSFREGEGSLSVAYLNARITRSFGDKLEDRSGGNISAEVTSKILVMGYGATDRWAVGAVLPFDATRTQFDSDANGSIDTKTKASGLGNPSFSVKYTMVRDPNVSVRVIAKLPTGYEAGVDYPEGDLDLAYSVSLGAVDLHLQAGYQYTGEDRNKVNPTDAVVANAALARSIGENFVLFTELNYRQAGGPLDTAPQPNALGVKEEAPTQKILDVTPGFKARFKESFLFSAAARISIINDFVFGYDYSYLTLLSYIF